MNLCPMNDWLSLLLHLCNILSDAAVKGKATIFTLETQTQLEGWNKRCGATGTLRTNNMIHQLKYQEYQNSLGIINNPIESWPPL